MKGKTVFIAVAITLSLIIAGQGFYIYRQFSEIQTLTIEHVRLQERYASLESEHSALISDHASLKGKYAHLESEYSALRLEYDTLVSEHDSLKREYASLEAQYTSLESKYSTLQSSYQGLKSEHDVIFSKASSGYVASTIVYYTEYGNEQRIVTIFIGEDTFKYYKEKYHASYSSDPASYVTSTETVIMSIVKTVKGYTQGEEELADALLSFVQDQQISLSIRYYTPQSRISVEAKYPVETLVEMGGDCKGHTILYASLLKAGGYKVIILITSDRTHTLVGVHLTNPPSHGTQKSYWYMTYKEERYYMAETTAYEWRVGDCPTDLQTQTFNIYYVD